MANRVTRPCQSPELPLRPLAVAKGIHMPPPTSTHSVARPPGAIPEDAVMNRSQNCGCHRSRSTKLKRRHHVGCLPHIQVEPKPSHQLGSCRSPGARRPGNPHAPVTERHEDHASATNVRPRTDAPCQSPEPTGVLSRRPHRLLKASLGRLIFYKPCMQQAISQWRTASRDGRPCPCARSASLSRPDSIPSTPGANSTMNINTVPACPSSSAKVGENFDPNEDPFQGRDTA